MQIKTDIRPVGRKWNGGGLFFVKKWTFPPTKWNETDARLIFYFTFYLFGGCVGTQRTTLPTGLDISITENVQCNT